MNLPSAAAAQPSRWATPVQILCLLLAWLATHVYWGIAHDAVLYVFQGLYHLHPELLKNDLGLRYGSQDRFSVFGALFARVIQLFGVDRASYLWSLGSQFAFAFVVWRLARHLMSGTLAWLAVGLMLALPGLYGGQGTFHIIEDFATPRLAAETLVFATLLLLVRNRMLGAVAFCIVALLLHPIMALPGLAMLLIWRWDVPIRRRLVMIGAAIVSAGLLAGYLASRSALRMDPFWFSLVTANSKYLLLANWSRFAWTNNLTPLATLAIGCLSLPAGTARRLSAGALFVGIGGLLISALGADLWHLTLVIQIQPWRCLWFSIAIATLTLPVIVGAIWQHGKLGRAAALLLIAVYAANGQGFAIALAAAAVGCAAFATRGPQLVAARSQQLLRTSATWILVACMLATLVSAGLSAGLAYEKISGVQLLDQVRSFTINSALGLPLLALAWYLARDAGHRLWLYLLGLVAGLGLVLLLPLAAPQWIHEYYPEQMQQSFATWRAAIPDGTEVMCPPKEPSICWILLQRPSYFSSPQVVAALFSRSAAVEIHQRASRMSAFLAASGLPLLTTWDGTDAPMSLPDVQPTEESLQNVCGQMNVRFLVTREDLGPAPLATLDGAIGEQPGELRLYACQGAG
ncbi:MAG: hypothetical protein ABSE43_00035 [Steroidobacteraceae bacterium]